MSMLQTEPLRRLVGVNGILELYSDHLVVRKKGLLSRFSFTFSGNALTISLYRLVGVKLYPGVMLTNGVLRLITPDGNLFLFFTQQTYPLALEIKDTIEDLLSRQQVFPEIKARLNRT